jgi:hypothetical protein
MIQGQAQIKNKCLQLGKGRRMRALFIRLENTFPDAKRFGAILHAPTRRQARIADQNSQLFLANVHLRFGIHASSECHHT